MFNRAELAHAAATPAHGFAEDGATWRLLRSRPPRAALAWAGAVLGGPVTSVRVLRGGTSSAMHVLTVSVDDGAVERVVLRRYVRPELNVEEPDIAQREVGALRFVEGLELPTPRLLAADPTGAEADVPALLMSRLPGRVDWSPPDMDRWLRGLADVLPAIHAAPLPPRGVIRPYGPYHQERYDPPGWARWPGIWASAVEVFHDPIPDASTVFMHRDFHPGNVLWQRGKVTGVVDWQAASIGPSSIDVGHCRVNLLSYGRDVADRFTAVWEGLSGLRYHPWADVAAIIDRLDEFRDDPPSGAERLAVEDMLARSVAELGRDPT